ncbi:MAG: SufD family Fe-S cluster assembly protein [Caldilineaceae bacterium]
MPFWGEIPICAGSGQLGQSLDQSLLGSRYEWSKACGNCWAFTSQRVVSTSIIRPCRSIGHQIALVIYSSTVHSREKARSVYMGQIHVLPGAQKTDAYQRNGNLILDSGARADSVPGLEIQADDVRCTHAALAQVEDEYVFYLMARGLSRAQAERMIVQGFFQAVLDPGAVESVVAKARAGDPNARLAVDLAIH